MKVAGLIPRLRAAEDRALVRVLTGSAVSAPLNPISSGQDQAKRETRRNQETYPVRAHTPFPSVTAALGPPELSSTCSFMLSLFAPARVTWPFIQEAHPGEPRKTPSQPAAFHLEPTLGVAQPLSSLICWDEKIPQPRRSRSVGLHQLDRRDIACSRASPDNAV